MSNSSAYVLGRLFAALVEKGAAKPTLFPQAGPMNPALLGPVLNAFTAKATEAELDWISPLAEELPLTAFGKPFTQEDETRFWLGYYHQKRALSMGESPAPTGHGGEPVAQDSTLKVRLPSELHEWVRQNGGSSLVRSLLDIERGRRQGA